MAAAWINTLSSLDMNIVSHGGVGSNYLVDYLQKKGLKVRSDPTYGHICHYPRKLIPTQPCLYVYGDIPNAILSMHRRSYLITNMNKIRLGIADQTDRREPLLRQYPDDPIGIKDQIRNFQNTENTVMLRYPYTVKELEEALQKLGFHPDLSGFQVWKRRSEYQKGMVINDPYLRCILAPYLH